MKSLFAAFLLAGAAFAQSSNSASSSSSAAASSSAAPSGTVSGSASGSKTATGTNTASLAASTAGSASYQVPPGISANCSTFLVALDKDPDVGACIGPLLNATAACAPTNNATAATLLSTLNTLCNSPICSDSLIRTQLLQFAAACPDELTGPNPNQAVLDTYDILYVLQPMHKSLCSKDGSTYCVLKGVANDTTPIASLTLSAGPAVANNAVDLGSDSDKLEAASANVLSNGIVWNTPPSRRRAQTPIVQYAPNTQVYRDNGVMYLMTLPDMSASNLCTNCTSQVMANYLGWEREMPYCAGLSQSPMLGTQVTMWQQMQAKCGAGYMQNIQTDSNTVAGQMEASGALATVSGGLGSRFTVVLAIALGLFVAL